MAFAAPSNGRTVQSGTDTDLSGLASVTGVRTEVVTGASSGTTTYYYMGSLAIDVTGTLSHNPDKEVLVFDDVPDQVAPIRVQSGGTFNYGQSYTKNGATIYAKGMGIKDVTTLHGRNGFNGAYRVRGAVLVNGGRFNWTGGGIESPFMFSVDDGVLDIFEGWMSVPYDSGTNMPSVWIQSASDTINIRNLTIYSLPNRRGVNFQFSKAPDIFDGVVANFCWGIGTGGSTLTTGGVATTIPIKNFAPEGADNEASFWRQNYVKLINFVRGSDVKTGGMLQGSNSVNYGIVETHQELSLSFKDATGSAIQGLRAFIRDTDDGNRSADWRGLSWTADRTYDNTTDASGEIAAFEVLTSAQVKRTGGDWQADIAKSYRGINGDTTDVFEVHPWSYLHAYATVSASLRGLGGTAINWTMFDDSLITERTLTTVQAYTALETAAKIYDYQKSWKLTGSNIEQPTPKTLPLTRVGETVDAGAFNFVANAGAADVFAFANSTVTVRAATLNADVETTGAITLAAIADGRTIKSSQNVTISTLPNTLTLDNAVLNIPPNTDISDYTEVNGGSYKATADGTYFARGKAASIIDANGHTITVVTGLQAKVTPEYAGSSTYSVYPTEADAITTTNAISSGLAKGSAYTYNVTSGTVYLRRDDVLAVFPHDTATEGDSNTLSMYFGSEIQFAQADVLEEMAPQLLETRALARQINQHTSP